MTNSQVLEKLRYIRDCYQRQGDKFRALAYSKAIKNLETLAVEFKTIKDLTRIQGVGKGIASTVSEILTTGTCVLYEGFLKVYPPPSVSEFTQLKGIGPVKAVELYKKYGKSSLKELEDAINSGEIKDDSIKEKIEFAKREKERTPLGSVILKVEDIILKLSECPHVLKAEMGGSGRRRKATVRDIDIIVATTNPSAVSTYIKEIFTNLQLLADGTEKLRFIDPDFQIQMDFVFTRPESWGAAINYATGSMDFNVAIRTRALARGYKVNEHGVFDSEGNKLDDSTEESLFKVLGIPFVPPVLRETNAYVGKTPPVIVQRSDLLGDLHIHTHNSDGALTEEQVVQQAIGLGYAFVGISDHSQSLIIANGLKPDQLLKQIGRIRTLQKQYSSIKILAGSEMDVKHDGTLDWPEEILSQLDYVLAALHNAPGGNVTHRILKAMEHPKVICIAHPSGRQFGSRDIAEADWDAIFSKAVETNTALEINSQPDRLDLPESLILLAKQRGVKFMINSDSHGNINSRLIQCGVEAAQRAGLTCSDILNAGPPDKIKTLPFLTTSA